MYFYFEPSWLMGCSSAGSMDVNCPPRLYFEDAALWQTVHKLMSLVESAAPGDLRYFEALAKLLIRELVRLDYGLSRNEQPSRGGLAAWQQRMVIAHIEEHLTERISLTKLAQIAQRSLHHFCRAFKHSLGMPPRRYQTNRRIERAKQMLANSTLSTTEIGLTLGFCDASSFATRFRKATGVTPRAYRQKSLEAAAIAAVETVEDGDRSPVPV
jgi:AraC family transcriptional regulator